MAPLSPEWAESFWERVDRSGGPHACWPWTGHVDRRSGVGYVSVPGRRRPRTVASVAYQLTHGLEEPVPVHHVCPGQVCSSCCNGEEHIAPGRPRVDRERQPQALSREVVAEIQASTERASDLARRLGVSRSTIHRLRPGRRSREERTA